MSEPFIPAGRLKPVWQQAGKWYIWWKSSIMVLLSLVALMPLDKVHAQLRAGVNRSPEVKVLTDTDLVASASLEQVYTQNGEKDRFIKNIITLRINEDINAYIPEDFSVSFPLLIEYGHTNYTDNQMQQTLTVSYKKAEGVHYDAIKYISFDGAEKVRVTIGTPSYSAATLSNGWDVRKLLLLQNEMRVTCYYDLNASGNTPSFGQQSSTGDELHLSWTTPASAGNNGLQLEWTWLQREARAAYGNTSGTALDLNKLFKNNATRIDLPYGREHYSIPLLYEDTGKVYYRIRSVSFTTSGSRIDGSWSAVDSFAFNGHGGSLNWQVATSFAEEGKRKSVVQYFDGSLRSRQTVTKDNSTNTVITAETFYDGQGRPAVQILPTPGMNSVIAYTKNLNLFNGQASNTNPAALFDLEPRTPPVSTVRSDTLTLSTGSGASLYYSPANPLHNTELHADIPDAEGYPYSVTRYMPDGTGRIMAQSGVGAALRMGSTHETKYYYGGVAQEELDGLFGTEAGNAAHYAKNMVKDANGQMSVNYVDMNGRTVATALAGDAPTGVTPLPVSEQYHNQSGSQVFRNLLDSAVNTVRNNSLEAVTTLLVPATTSYAFHYQLTPATLQLARCGSNIPLSYDCMYNLEFSITDESGDTPPIVRKFNNINPNADDTVSTGVQPFVNDSTAGQSNQIDFTQTLLPGSYSIRKTLTVSEASITRYRDMYLEKAQCKSRQELTDSIAAVMLAASDCNTSPGPLCETCLASLGSYGDYRARYIQPYGNNPWPSEAVIHAAYSADSADCLLSCSGGVSRRLETVRTLMLSDMIPFSGQYAKSATPAGSLDMYNKYDIFAATNSSAKFYYQRPLNPDRSAGYYYDDFHNFDPGIYSDINHLATKLDQTSREEFTSLFSYSWAQSLLPYHPEYARLQWAEQQLGASYNWIEGFNNADTYSQAAAGGYMLDGSSFGTTPADPFFSIATSMKTAIANLVSGPHYYRNLSLWQIAYGNAICKTLLDQHSIDGCYKNAPYQPPFTSLTTEQKDQVWLAFRSLYSSVRDSMVTAYIQLQKPLSDENTLIQRGYLLRFANASQSAVQYPDWNTWYPSTPGGPLPASAAAAAANQYKSNCAGYIDNWKQTLLECPALNERTDKDAIVTEITTLMQSVCEKGADAAHPFGSSTVNPSTQQNGSMRSFEEVVDSILWRKYGIDTSLLCNPYVISYPKPYDRQPVYAQGYTATVDTCMCNQFGAVKAAATAQQYNPNSLASLNTYLKSRYADTLTEALFAGLQQCAGLKRQICDEPAGGCDECRLTGCRDTVVSYQLQRVQPLPRYLVCGYVEGSACLTCDGYSTLRTQFQTLFPTADYSAGTPLSGDDLGSNDIRYNTLFAQFLNARTGLDYSWQDWGVALAVCDQGESNGATTIVCLSSKPVGDTSGLYVAVSPCQSTLDKAAVLAVYLYELRRQRRLADFEVLYRRRCLDVKEQEQFQVTYTTKEYHYTLYYYDQSGSLVKTVPPKGVMPEFDTSFTNRVKTARVAGTVLRPDHGLASDYRYNSLGQVVAQHTPDGGTSQFWYDRLGRLAMSRNAQQVLDGKYSYTLYDELGRITEVGQKPQSVAMTQVVSQDTTQLRDWLFNQGGTREQLTITVYDTINPFIQGAMLKTSNLRGRVSHTMTKELASDAFQHSATHYSYDVHGNVDTLVQDHRLLWVWFGDLSNRYKKVVYNYDLVSGKVNGVSYQRGEADAFYHRYDYDAENRLTDVWTSRDSLMWEHDANYRYYRHGPLGRLVVGQQNVQGLDYRYTLQGWLKGVNRLEDAGIASGSDSSISGGGSCAAGTAPNVLVLDTIPATVPQQFVARESIIANQGFESILGDSFEMLVDASLGECQSNGSGGSINNSISYPLTAEHKPVAKDVMAFSLHYYGDDYKAIGGPVAAPDALLSLGNEAAPLYNGNIAAMTVSIPKAGEARLYNYHYDQLNRLVSMDAYKGLNASGSFTPIPLQDYKERVSYDPNGNILAYLRNGTINGGRPLPMDSMCYHYTAGTNRLSSISDTVSLANYTEDIDMQSAGNYSYDAIGNLIKDSSQGISAVSWTVYGKIASINKGSRTISYTYDASGNRITKRVGDTTTIYVRDASGNVLSVYEKQGSASITQREVHLYGSSRLGIINGISVASVSLGKVSTFGETKVTTFTRGEKRFELSNHLGNVLATASDRRQQHTSRADTVDYYLAEVASASDYAPFGMGLVGRTYNNRSYRYGFNGKENDQETSTQDYGMRIYDPRVSRFLSTDPLTYKYPSWSPYPFAMNSPISGVDLDGLEYYYAADGKFLGRRTTDADGNQLDDKTANGARLATGVRKVYDGKMNRELTIYDNVTDLNISNKDFLRAAGLAYSETGLNQDAIERLPYAIVNHHKQLKDAGVKKYGSDWDLDKTIAKMRVISDNTYANGTAKNPNDGNPAFQAFLGIKEGDEVDFDKNSYGRNENPLMVMAIRATIGALNYLSQGKGTDPSNGAIGWHGTDIYQSDYWKNHLFINAEHIKFGFINWKNTPILQTATFKSVSVYKGNFGTTLFYKSTENAFTNDKKGGL